MHPHPSQPPTQACRDCGRDFPYDPEADICPRCVAEASGAEAVADHPSCSCTWADDGDGESGPSPYIVRVDEACPTHGRAANPERWAEDEAQDRHYALAALQAALADLPRTVEAHADFAYGLVQHAEALVERELPEDDGHNFDRAISRAAAALRALHAGS